MSVNDTVTALLESVRTQQQLPAEAAVPLELFALRQSRT